MRIDIKRLTAKNIMSVGNTPIDIRLNTHKKNYITGKNGAGKSTILIEALTFALFGRPYRRINKPQLVNTVNKKGLLVELEFSVNDIDYKIVRGISPGIFEIWRDQEQIQESAAVKDFQEYLEKTILKVSYRTFKQIVVLGTAGFSPFMALSPGDRRKVVEDILGIEVFSIMTQMNKDAIGELSSDILKVDGDIKLLEQRHELIKRHNDDNSEKVQSQIEMKYNSISNIKETLEGIETRLESLRSQREKLLLALSGREWDENLPGLYAKRGEFDSREKANKKAIKFFESNDHCPTCTQGIIPEFKVSKVNETLNLIKEDAQALAGVIQEIDKEESIKARDLKIDGHLAKLKADESSLCSDKRNWTRAVSDLESEILELNQKQIKDMSKPLLALESKIAEVNDRKFDLLNDRYCRQVVANLLKDSGIKSMIIGQYIPIINKSINHYLGLMGANYQFELNSEFSESVKTRGKEDFSYSSFSQGERYRIDLAILFTWRDLIKQKSGSSFNILVMDEVMDSAADQDGIDALVDIIDSIDDGVYIISHSEKIDSMSFDRLIEVKKIGNFSSIEISN